MSTKSYDAALDFLPAAKASNGGPRLVSLLKAVVEAFEEGLSAEARYKDLVAHGVSHDEAARKVFNITYKTAA